MAGRLLTTACRRQHCAFGSAPEGRPDWQDHHAQIIEKAQKVAEDPLDEAVDGLVTKHMMAQENVQVPHIMITDKIVEAPVIKPRLCRSSGKCRSPGSTCGAQSLTRQLMCRPTILKGYDPEGSEGCGRDLLVEAVDGLVTKHRQIPMIQKAEKNLQVPWIMIFDKIVDAPVIKSRLCRSSGRCRCLGRLFGPDH